MNDEAQVRAEKPCVKFTLLILRSALFVTLRYGAYLQVRLFPEPS